MKRISSTLVKGFALGLFGLSLTGCTALTGLIDAADDFGCPMGKGTNCTTLTATHKKVTKALDDKKSEGSLKVAPPVKKEEVTPNLSNEAQAISLEEDGAKAPNVVSSEKDAPKALSDVETRLNALAHKPLVSNPIGRKGLVKGNSNAHWRNTNGAKARMPERVMFLWVLPWVDTDGDLHGESRLWVKVRDAKWGVEKLRLEAMNRGAPEMTP